MRITFRLVGLLVLCTLLALSAWQAQPEISRRPEIVPESEIPTDSETLTIASFNIQVFGQSKADNPQVMETLAAIIRRFDLTAIQEIRSIRQDVIPRLIDRINSAGVNYAFEIGPRLGRTSSKEQYAFIYNANRVELVADSIYTPLDPGDRLHREPLVARFRARGPPERQAFTFTLVNVHTDPDEVDPHDPGSEINALADFYIGARMNGWQEDDVILLGDLNADTYNLGELGQLQNIRAAIAGRPTNTRRTKTYDNLLFMADATTEFTGNAGVFDIQQEFGLTLDEALEVSDHLPVWGKFRIHEDFVIGPLAANPNP